MRNLKINNGLFYGILQRFPEAIWHHFFKSCKEGAASPQGRVDGLTKPAFSIKVVKSRTDSEHRPKE